MSFENRRSTMEGGATAGGPGPDVQSQAGVSLCKTGCGFYANSAFEGMCSKCFRDDLLRRKEVEQFTSPSSSHESSSSCSAASPAGPKATDISLDAGSSNRPTTSSDTTATSPNTTATDATHASAEDSSTVAAADFQSIETGSPTIITAKISDKDRVWAVCSEGAEEEVKAIKEKSKKHRCLTCRKKVGLTGFPCRCGGLFCAVHRYSDKHDCSFDYKELGQEQIRKNNPVVVGEKIKKL